MAKYKMKPTNKQKVNENYPNAFCHNVGHCDYEVYVSAASHRVLGKGRTSNQAWKRAWETTKKEMGIYPNI